MEKNFETNNEVISEWVNVKLRDVCRCIGIFLNYLLIPRTKFIHHSNPNIPLSVVKYVIEEIFNCDINISVISSSSFSDDFALKTRSNLREFITSEFTISSNAIEYIWKYIQMGVENITKGIDTNEKLDKLKSSKKRIALQNRKKDLEEFKTNTKNQKDKYDYMSYKISVYTELKEKIDNAIKNADIYITKYRNDNDFRTHSVVVVFSIDEQNLLIELGVNNKKIKRMVYYKEFEDEVNRDYNRNNNIDYSQTILTILEKQQATLERIRNEINESNISKMMEDTKKYSDKNINIDNFINELSKSLTRSIDEIENDDSIRFTVQQQVINKIKTRIAVFQSYVSNKSCENKLDRDVDGCILQSIFYLSVTLADWLDQDYIDRNEILYALQILLPEELTYLVSQSSSEDDNITFNIEFTKLVNLYKIKLQKDGYRELSVFSGIINKIEGMNPQSIEYEKFNNRVRYFANSL